MYRYATPLTALLLVALTGALLIAGCSTARPAPYAEAYEAALARYPGHAPVADAPVADFIAFFTHEAGTAQAVADPADLYAERFYFSDTLVTTDDPARALAHLQRMRTGTEAIRVRLLNRVDDGADIYLVWHMEAEFAPVRATVTSTTVGITHLRFDAAGRIVLHQDFWDASEGFYQHVPVLGGMIHRIRRSFQHDDP